MTTSAHNNQLPAEAIIVDADGLPKAHINFDQLTTDASRLMLELAATAGDDDATDRVGAKWVSSHDPDYYGYMCAAALSLMVRNVLAPCLDAAAAVGLDLRAGLRKCAAESLQELGDDQ